MNYYEALGIKESATQDEIKSAYLKLVTQCHPDKNPNNKDAEEKTKQINNAYQILKDPKKKAQYDLSLSSGTPYDSGNANRGFYYHRYTNLDDDLLREIFPEDIFQSFGAGFTHTARNKQQTKNQDIYISLSVTLKEAFFGAEKLAQLKEGSEIKTISIKIPSGIKSGMKLRLKEQAPRYNLSLPAGDLLVQINVQNVDGFGLVNDNLVSVLKVSPLDALTGATVEFKNIDDEVVRVSIPAGTRHTDYVKIEGKGMPIFGENGRNNLMLQVQTEKLDNLPPKILNKLKKLSSELKNQ